MDITTLTSAIWVFTGVLSWATALATYVVFVELRRRKRTDTKDDDWR